MPEALHGSDWTLLATLGPLVIGVLLIIWVVWKGCWRDHVRIHRRFTGNSSTGLEVQQEQGRQAVGSMTARSSGS